MAGLQQQLDPQAAARLVEDKKQFYLFCRERGLPAPELLAHWTPAGGETADGPVSIEGNAWWDPNTYPDSMGAFLRFASSQSSQTVRGRRT